MMRDNVLDIEAILSDGSTYNFGKIKNNHINLTNDAATKIIFDHLMKKNYKFFKIEKFIQELCWRDYWQLVWKEKKDLINYDLKHKQIDVSNYQISSSIVNAETSLDAIDDAILNLYKTGYMHNHLRMYVASLSCNISKSHWNHPAKWLYYLSLIHI